MTRALRWGVVLALAALAWPEFGVYSAERVLRDAGDELTSLLSGAVTGSSIQPAAEQARRYAARAGATLVTDPRPPLVESTALLVLRNGPEARAVLDRAIRRGERPELTLNLGRARGISGDEAGAQAAFLRTAWVNPYSVTTLPSGLREPILTKVKELEGELAARRLRKIPAL